MDTEAFLQQIEKLPGYRGQVVHVERLPARGPSYAGLEIPLPRPLLAALRAAGASRLYSHQAQAIDAIRAGNHVVVSTGTASGKTLAYNVPVLEVILADPQARALYLFPTKALAQDQLRSLRELTEGGLSSVRFGAYDGDTPKAARTRLRSEARILLTNPDMLHVGILPNHTLWADFFANLRFLVLDEAHVYRGVFGSQVGCVLRRLWRVCARYGSAPQVIACSATIADPAGHVRRLAGVDARPIDQDGAPRGSRNFVLWNPPAIDRAGTARRSPNIEAASLFARLVQAGIRTIVFARARRVAELILLYARRILEDESPGLAGRIRAYRAGYRPEQRREIERGLRPGGGLLGVATTSALELGIDIGDLDAAVLVGYPGTVASLWQQAGRAGRGTRHALAVLVAQDGPLDQYFLRHPGDLFGRPHEHALTDPSNPYLLVQHLPCAAQELPLGTGSEAGGESNAAPSPGGRTAWAAARAPRRALPGRRRLPTPPASVHRTPGPGTLPPGVAEGDDEALFGPGFVQAMVALEQRGDLEYRANRWYPRPGAYPAQEVSLRALRGSRVALLNAAQNYRILEEMETTAAPYRVHPGAVYLHQGESFLVRELDLDVGHAILEPVQVDYYTQPREINDLRVVRAMEERAVGDVTVCLGGVQVTQQVIGFRRVQQFREETLSVEDLVLPTQTFGTVALWWNIPQRMAARVQQRGMDLAGGLHAVEHAAIGLLPLFAMCDRWDIGGLSTPCHPDTGEAQVFLYDAFPGGVGIAEKGFDLLPRLWRATHEAVRDCPCQDGCPSCIQSPKCGNNNQPLDKRAAVLILSELLKGA
ncbi:MAG TPA: DEAD/DEAH box helicase [Anaerolineae bacterium]|nr:DEAD/DEAH box helicase [Anaerolineae bacterium]